MMEKIEGDTLLVFVEDIGANQYQIKQAVKKLTTQCAQGQHGLRVWWTEVCPRTSPWLACFGYCQPLWHHVNWVQLAGSKYTWFYHPKWRMGRRSSDKSNNIHPRCHLANILRMPLTYPQREPHKLPFHRSQQEQFVQWLFTYLNPVLSLCTIHLPTPSSVVPLHIHTAMSRKARPVLESEQHDILFQLERLFSYKIGRRKRISRNFEVETMSIQCLDTE